MRLAPEVVCALVEGLSPHLDTCSGAELLLFGSRVNDRRRGGDIDLLLLIDDKTTRDRVRMAKIDILADWKRRLGEQKIDFRIASRDEAATDAFLKVVLSSAVPLHSW